MRRHVARTETEAFCGKPIKEARRTAGLSLETDESITKPCDTCWKRVDQIMAKPGFTIRTGDVLQLIPPRSAS